MYIYPNPAIYFRLFMTRKFKKGIISNYKKSFNDNFKIGLKKNLAIPVGREERGSSSKQISEKENVSYVD